MKETMSRVIVKNLPKKVTPERLREVFSSKGEITDINLKYTKDGAFRQFAFIGFKTVEEAETAKKYFDNSFFNASKIQVEMCYNIDDPSKPKARSKHSKDSSERKKKKQKSNDETLVSKPEEKSKYQEMLDEAKGDENFKEFLELHNCGPNKPIWSNDAAEFKNADDSSEEVDKELETENKEETPVSNKGKHMNNIDDEFTVKVRGLPYKCKKKNIKEFFHPLKIVSLRLPPKVKGIAFVKLKTEKAMKQALNKHRSFLSGHKIDVVKYTKKIEAKPEEKPQDKYADKLKEIDEGIAESGRIFVRNLSYTVTEEDLDSLFNSYGTLTEVSLPIDSYTKKVKGFAFITYMFPEHAVKAFTALDRTIFQGRILHLLPSKEKKVYKNENSPSENSSFKQKKLNLVKELCHSPRNWNTLFIGANALADVLIDKYSTTKTALLDAKSSESLAVRMALGETQIVTETREFLIEHGVALDSFNQPATERSKTILLVKHLPAKTKPEAIQELFSQFGGVINVILPPSGVTAIVEFESPADARKAFNKVSYTMFQNSRLYLEWAPVNVFSSHPGQTNNAKDIAVEKTDENDEDDDIQPVNSTLYVKNLDFTTTEEALKKHFKKAGKIHHVTIATKKDPNNPGSLLSMGYGFVAYKKRSSAQEAIKTLQHSVLDGRELELKFSNQATQSQLPVARKQSSNVEERSSKILVKNIPFEATAKEVEKLFSVFGEIKNVRLPKKLYGTGRHRGFGFVEFVTKNDAKRAFKTLCHSTHLLGRRLALEWAKTEDDDDVSTLRRKTSDNFHKSPSKKQKRSSDEMS